MPLVVIATWSVRPGSEDVIEEILGQLSRESRLEPGNLAFQAYRDPTAPSTFRIFEMYRDEEALRSHSESAHFIHYVVDAALPNLESRVREVFESVG